ncbi:hypothetical protein [Streptomyces canus]|uniref:hypothetical protein n=1 Tax=Streptomyces canus TaxID=58343 RepID=UPI0003A7B57B|nr:hypothetical protein [Streptomyces canus]
MAKSLAKTRLPEVRDRLETIGPLGDDSLSERGEAVVRRLSRRDEMRYLLDGILSDDRQLGEIAARSYYHANSFLKIVLAVGDENAWKLRLHVWHPRSEADLLPREDIHSHRWDFTTALLLGEYNAREYMIAPGDDYHHYRYTPVRADQHFSLEAMGSKQLAKVCEVNVQAGTVYHLDHRILHSIARSNDGPTATVVLQGPMLRDTTNVYRTSPVSEEGGGDKGIYVERPSVDQLRGELAQLHHWL